MQEKMRGEREREEERERREGRERERERERREREDEKVLCAYFVRGEVGRGDYDTDT